MNIKARLTQTALAFIFGYTLVALLPLYIVIVTFFIGYKYLGPWLSKRKARKHLLITRNRPLLIK
jgi:hypothetical protein